MVYRLTNKQNTHKHQSRKALNSPFIKENYLHITKARLFLFWLHELIQSMMWSVSVNIKWCVCPINKQMKGGHRRDKTPGHLNTRLYTQPRMTEMHIYLLPGLCKRIYWAPIMFQKPRKQQLTRWIQSLQPWNRTVLHSVVCENTPAVCSNLLCIGTWFRRGFHNNPFWHLISYYAIGPYPMRNRKCLHWLSLASGAKNCFVQIKTTARQSHGLQVFSVDLRLFVHLE